MCGGHPVNRLCVDSGGVVCWVMGGKQRIQIVGVVGDIGKQSIGVLSS